GMRRLDTMPENVRWSSRRAAREKGPSAEHRMSLAKGDHVPHEPEETGVPVLQRPVHPACAVVLAPGIVVAVLTAEELISPQDHGNSLRDQERCHQVAHLPLADADDRGILRRSLHSAVPAQVAIAAVPVSL